MLGLPFEMTLPYQTMLTCLLLKCRGVEKQGYNCGVSTIGRFPPAGSMEACSVHGLAICILDFDVDSDAVFLLKGN